MDVIITVNMDSAAMQGEDGKPDPTALVTVLAGIVGRIDFGYSLDMVAREPLRDANGKNVGSFRLADGVSQSAILREAAAIMERRFGPITTERERASLESMAKILREKGD